MVEQYRRVAWAERRRMRRMDEARYATALVVARDNMKLKSSFPGSVVLGRGSLLLQRP